MPKIRGLVFKKTINQTIWKFCTKIFKRIWFELINDLLKSWCYATKMKEYYLCTQERSFRNTSASSSLPSLLHSRTALYFYSKLSGQMRTVSILKSLQTTPSNLRQVLPLFHATGWIRVGLSSSPTSWGQGHVTTTPQYPTQTHLAKKKFAGTRQ